MKQNSVALDHSGNKMRAENCRGLYDEAEALAQFSLDIARSVHKNDENQTMLRRHRCSSALFAPTIWLALTYWTAYLLR